MVKSKTCRDAEILVRNPSPRLFGEKFWDSKKKKQPWKNETSRLVKNASEISRSCQNSPRPTFFWGTIRHSYYPHQWYAHLCIPLVSLLFKMVRGMGGYTYLKGGCFLILWPRRWVLIRALLLTQENTVYPPHPSLSDSINLATSVLPIPCFQQNVMWKCSFNIIIWLPQFCILESFEWIKEWNSPGWKGLSRLQLYCSLW